MESTSGQTTSTEEALMPETQDCRDCGRPFPYDPDADRCPGCVAELLGDDEGETGHRYTFRTDGRDGLVRVDAADASSADAEARRLRPDAVRVILLYVDPLPGAPCGDERCAVCYPWPRWAA